MHRQMNGHHTASTCGLGRYIHQALRFMSPALGYYAVVERDAVRPIARLTHFEAIRGLVGDIERLRIAPGS